LRAPLSFARQFVALRAMPSSSPQRMSSAARDIATVLIESRDWADGRMATAHNLHVPQALRLEHSFSSARIRFMRRSRPPAGEGSRSDTPSGEGNPRSHPSVNILRQRRRLYEGWPLKEPGQPSCQEKRTSSATFLPREAQRQRWHPRRRRGVC